MNASEVYNELLVIAESVDATNRLKLERLATWVQALVPADNTAQLRPGEVFIGYQDEFEKREGK